MKATKVYKEMKNNDNKLLDKLFMVFIKASKLNLLIIDYKLWPKRKQARQNLTKIDKI